MSFKEWLIREIKEWTEAIIIAAVLAILIRTFIFQVYKIPSGSMIPTLRIGDRVIAWKLPYGPRIPFTHIKLPKWKDPKRGDIIVFLYPLDPKKHFVKRLIAKGGETVEIKSGTVFVDGKPLLEGPFRDITYYNLGPYGEEGKKIKVPPHHYYVLGDNSLYSKDSRYWGFVPEENLVGKVVFRFWPPNRIGKVR